MKTLIILAAAILAGCAPGGPNTPNVTEDNIFLAPIEEFRVQIDKSLRYTPDYKAVSRQKGALFIDKATRERVIASFADQSFDPDAALAGEKAYRVRDVTIKGKPWREGIHFIKEAGGYAIKRVLIGHATDDRYLIIIHTKPLDRYGEDLNWEDPGQLTEAQEGIIHQFLEESENMVRFLK